MRHGSASNETSLYKDIDRPLSNSGIQEAIKAAKSIASKNPKSLAGTGMGLGSIFALFLIAWLLSGNEVHSSYSEFGVDASLSKFIGGMLILVYMLVGLAVSGIIYSEITKSLKNG